MKPSEAQNQWNLSGFLTPMPWKALHSCGRVTRDPRVTGMMTWRHRSWMQHQSPQSLMRDPLLLGAAVAAGVIVVGVAAGGTVAGAAAGAGPSLLGVVAVAGATVVGAAAGAVVGATEVGAAVAGAVAGATVAGDELAGMDGQAVATPTQGYIRLSSLKEPT